MRYALMNLIREELAREDKIKLTIANQGDIVS
jgi:hypothetical protein